MAPPPRLQGMAAIFAILGLVALKFSPTARTLFAVAFFYAAFSLYYERLLADLMMWKLKDSLGWTVLISAASFRVDFAHGLQ